MANELTTLARVKEYLGIATGTTTYDAQIESLITSTSRFVEKYCDVESWLSASHVEIHNGNGAGWVSLRNRPLTAVSRISTRPVTALTLSNESDSVQRASVQCTSTGITLSSTASGVVSSSTLLFATYVTLTDLSDAIEALGWTATIASGYELFPSSDLRSLQYASATSEPAELEIYTEELPISRIDEEPATIWGYFPCGVQNIEVRYTAGYANIDALPEDLEQGVIALTASMFNMTQSASSGSGGGVKREKIGDYEIERFDTTTLTSTNLSTFSTDAYALLQSFRRVRAL